MGISVEGRVVVGTVYSSHDVVVASKGVVSCFSGVGIAWDIVRAKLGTFGNFLSGKESIA